MIPAEPYMISEKEVDDLEVFAIIDGINARKNALEMTNQQVADASGVPKSTVDRVLRKDTENPTMKVILDIAGAVGYEFGAPAAVQVPDGSQDSQYIRHIISMYEAQLAAQERQYNLVTREKNRWIKILAIIVGILGIGVVAILLIDILNPTVGWIRRDVAYHSNTAFSLGAIIERLFAL